jgi:hypothetical protein
MNVLWKLASYAAAALTLGLVLSVSAAEDEPAAKPGEKRQLLSEHHTLASFNGVEFRLCRGRTALCPERCGHSGNFAGFTIKKYVKYKKHGEYGDPEQKSFHVQVSDFDKEPIGDVAIAKTIAGLKKGDVVLLSWNHDYVTKDGSSFPERPIVSLKKVTAEEAESMLGSKS